MILKIRVANDFPNFAEVGKLLFEGETPFCPHKSTTCQTNSAKYIFISMN